MVDNGEASSWREMNQGEEAAEYAIREHVSLLPIANVGRIMKEILPPNAKISKEAKETVQECVTEFISFVTGEASDKCKKERQRTVNGDDICWALATLGFDNYVVITKRYLGKYREMEGDKIRNTTWETTVIFRTGLIDPFDDCLAYSTI